MRWYYVKPHAAVSQYYLVTAAVIIAVCGSARSDTTGGPSFSPVDITVYYESLCGDSIQFVRNQLVPAYRDIGSFFTVNYIPYGKATHGKYVSNGVEKWHFTCQHGPQECYGNKAQACGINDILTNPERTNKQQDLVNFVGCVMQARNPSTAVPQCLQTIGMDTQHVSLVENCISSVAGDELLAAYGDKTLALQPSLSFVPTITVDRAYSQEDQIGALRNLTATVCKHIPEHNKPLNCSG
ncbi:GILT-like protein 1 [Neodiprion virginianus]|uniref:GILT-like protein 1 n=1 Tax=Neodiprion fabricii TaxID=2872261 RepID=UPI001ED92E78|nr:GILT-like protein 1 [Neodiprion fabricii]XP_046409610.1 GILT-like protein 1 [Neodiprion fabricii]XP_046603063.1 GILT-like protein 1 [Neodiprion virginianus]XP_046603064.1 GILT-like protein 1 [Neodiprion virginianus]